ncbi:1,4-dihydroxy-2-naphthoate octaprenyltransferase [Schleiferia thermophila]|jgi:1,4-dihydroxy-2-naphthoate octaprenyltransferase|uniref:1,4-dihydroxy-2-naphthoate octaprenyltransferase n=1 Tax=Schleiferia thermophila TaxID=884107 RepID=UPI002FD9FF0B
MIKHWLAAVRLRTLPLSVSGIVLGTSIAAVETSINWSVFALAVTTALLFQVLSNFSNDLGDAIKGADQKRQGEVRMVSAGLISAEKMKKAILAVAMLSLLTGISLLYTALKDQSSLVFFVFLGLAIASIWSAIHYTYGSFPYGYHRLGEVFVIAFFGIVAVGGSYYLQTGYWNSFVLLPGLASGMFASAVLNLNNMRDIDTDLTSGKYTVANFLGFLLAKVYHTILVILPIILTHFFIRGLHYSEYAYLYLLIVPLVLSHLVRVWNTTEKHKLDSELKSMALSTLLYVLLLSIGINI